MNGRADVSRLLLIEDDPSLALGLCDSLEFEGFHVIHARSGREGLQSASDARPACIILDLMLPDTNGYRVCRGIRESDPSVPIIMLTARSQESDKIRGLDAGADDYVTKPFSVGELTARIRAVLRRAGGAGDELRELQIGAAVVDPRSQTLTRGEQQIALSFYEVEILRLLYEQQGRPVSREELLTKVWGHCSFLLEPHS